MLKMQTSDVETRGAHGGAPLQTNPIILYEGVCALCNRLNQFLLKRDIHDRFRFASLQSEFATKVLRRHGADPDDLDTVYVIEGYETPNE